MVPGLEIARVLKEFESTLEVSKPCSERHHKQRIAANWACELIVLDTKEIMPECVVQAIKTAKQKGQSQYDQFFEGRLVICSKAITDTVHRNKRPLFGMTEKAASKKTRNQISELKSDCNLFARL